MRDCLTRASHDVYAESVLADASKSLLDIAIYDFVLTLLPAEARPLPGSVA